MLRTRAAPVGLWEAVLPAEVLRLPGELARVDALLDDPVFFAPFVPFFDPRMGRPSTPMETYLRMMFLKFRYRLGYESLCREVADSITWRRFCRIPLDGRVPHPTTLMKLTTRCGSSAVDGCNEALLAKAADAKLLRTSRLRADTTVIPADVAYPTDSGLLARAVRRIAVTGRRIQAAGGGDPHPAARPQPVGRRSGRMGSPRSCGYAARRTGPRRRQTVQRITGELAGLAERAAADAQRLLANARRALRRAQLQAEHLAAGRRAPDPAAGRRRGRLRRAVNDLSRPGGRDRGGSPPRPDCASPGPPRTGRAGGSACTTVTPGPIAKGRLGKPVEFGYKAQVVDNPDGIVLDHTLAQGNPADAPQLAPAVERVITRTGRRPRTVTADRGYGETRVEDDLHRLGVRTVVIPRKGKPGKARQATERRPAFRKTVKWRTGSEGRISSLKRGYGWDRTRLDGTNGARIWTGQAVLVHNLVKIGALAN